MNAAAACSFNAGAKEQHDRPGWPRWLLVFLLLWGSVSSTAWAVNAWESVGPGGGVIRALAMSTDGQTLFAGTSSDGVFKSTNGGTSWVAIGNGLTNQNVVSLALSANGQTLFAGTSGGGVFKSINGGTSWAAFNNGLTALNVYSLALSTDGQTIVAGTNGGVFKSTNGATSWAAFNNGFSVPFVQAVALSSDGQTIFAAVNSYGVFKSTNGGASWAAVNNGLTHGYVVSLALTSDDQTILAGAPSGGVFKSIDGGTSWAAVNNGLTNQLVYSMAVSSNGQTIVAGTPGGVFKTTDGGTSWAAVNNGLTNQNLFSLALSSDGQTILAGAQGGVFKTTDGGNSWVTVNNGLNIQGAPSLALGSDGQTIFAGTYGDGVFKSTNGGNSWAAVSNGLTNQDVRSLALAIDGLTLFAGTGGGGVFKSTNGGTSWAAVNDGLTNQYLYSLALSSDAQTIFAGTYSGVFKSTNGGTSWIAVNNGLTHQDVYSLTLSNDGQTIFAGTNGGVFKSTNGATSWTAVNNGLTHLDVRSLALSNNGQTIFAGTTGGVFKSTNGATSWTAVNNGLTSQVVFSLALTSDGQTIFAGTFGGGVFKSTNGGNSWSATNTGLSSQLVNSLAMSSDGQTIFAGTENRSVFKSTNGALSSDSRLLDLTLVANGSTVALSPTFSSNALNYSTTVQGASATLTPTAWISDETITINGAPASSSTAFSVALDPGTNVIPVKVTSGDETSTRTYGITITRQIVAPAAPTNVQAALAQPGSGQVAISWTAPGSSGSSALTGYTVTGNPSGGCTAGPGQTSCVVSSMTSGTAYNFTVTATNAEGASTGSAASNSVTPQSTQTINFPTQSSQSFTTGGTFAINPAIASSGLGVTYGSLSMGVCTVSGATVTVVSAGTCMLTANQGGNAAWLPAVQATQNVLINKGTNTITFPAQGNQTYSAGGTFALSAASATSGLAVTYSSLTTGVCTVAGSTVSVQGAGTCTIAANQAGNSNWNVATQATQIISIAKGVNTITFGAQADQTYSLNGTFAVHPVATAASGLAVTYNSLTTSVCNLSGSMVVMQTAGTCTVAANQAGNANWAAATQVTQNITLQKGTNTITFPAQTNQTFSSNGTFALTPATASSGLTPLYSSSTPVVCSVAGSTVTMLNAGTCTVAADQAGDANWVAAAQVTQNVTIDKGVNTLSFPAQFDQTYSAGGTFTVNPVATAVSGLAVTYSSSSVSVCTVAGATVSILGAGVCTLAANQAGDANWAAAAQVTQNVNILAVTPGAPTTVQATPTASGQVTVTWTPPAQTGGGITGYVVTAQPGGNTCTPTPATATTCTFTGLVNGQTYTFTVEALNQAGSSTPPAPSNPATPLADAKSFSASTPTGSGTLTATVTGGGSTCRFEHVRVMAVGDAATAPPTSLSFPHGLLDFVLAGCDPTDATLSLTYPSALPQGVRYWKLNAGTWAPYSHAVAQPGTNTVTLTLRDGGQGDDDGQVNGRIVDPGQIGLMASTSIAPTPVPTLSSWSLILLGLGLSWLGVGRRRQ
ncbi:MAG: IPTL-CTERM sorting domain-containing protein, partial [Comamonadaceae bacterium]|nr:IPTL-CTERM sorting domain-containing protein [Comamonadaceae bacterium]